MAKRSTDPHGAVAAASASSSPLPRGVEVEFAIGCVVNGVAYTKGQRVHLPDDVAADLQRARGILIGYGDAEVMRTADATGGTRSTNAAPRREANVTNEEMARSSRDPD